MTNLKKLLFLVIGRMRSVTIKSSFSAVILTESCCNGLLEKNFVEKNVCICRIVIEVVEHFGFVPWNHLSLTGLWDKTKFR